VLCVCEYGDAREKGTVYRSLPRAAGPWMILRAVFLFRCNLGRTACSVVDCNLSSLLHSNERRGGIPSSPASKSMCDFQSPQLGTKECILFSLL
jgi:hypothetical protein